MFWFMLNSSYNTIFWWFNNIVYLPQEPSFISGSIRSNFLSFNPELKANDIHGLLEKVGLLALVDENPVGLDQKLQDHGRHLSLGVRRRLALARALSRDGILAILDEPTEGMDPEGSAAVYNVLNELVQKDRTVILFSHDRTIVRGAHKFLNLGDGASWYIGIMSGNFLFGRELVKLKYLSIR